MSRDRLTPVPVFVVEVDVLAVEPEPQAAAPIIKNKLDKRAKNSILFIYTKTPPSNLSGTATLFTDSFAAFIPAMYPMVSALPRVAPPPM
jgi:hypothetical protein